MIFSPLHGSASHFQTTVRRAFIRVALFLGLGIDPDRHRAVVDECDLHIGSKSTPRHRLPDFRFQETDKLFVERDRRLGAGGSDVGRAVAFPGAGERAGPSQPETRRSLAEGSCGYIF